MLFRITNGLTPLTLSSGGPSLGVTYVPAASTQPKVAETVKYVLEGTNSAIVPYLNQLELLFNAARWGNEKVYLEYRPLDTGDIMRARIYDGFILWPSEPIKRVLSTISGLVEVEVVFERDNSWQGPEEEVYMSSAFLSERTGGVTITGAANQNYVHILDSRVKGTRKAPIKIKVTNSSGTALSWRNFYLGNNVFSTPTGADLWITASESTTGTGNRTWGANSGTEHQNLTWLFPLSNTLLNYTFGRSFKVIALFDAHSNVNTYLRASIGPYISGFYLPSFLGQERSFWHEVTDLGELPFPPGGVGVSNANSALALTVRSTTTSGGATLNYVMLMPTDSNRHWFQSGFDVANGDYILDDGIDGGIYAYDSSGRYSIVQAPTMPLYIFPNRVQRIHTIVSEDTGFNTSRTFTIQAWYRPIYDNF